MRCRYADQDLHTDFGVKECGPVLGKNSFDAAIAGLSLLIESFNKLVKS